MSEELLAANILTFKFDTTHPKWGAVLAVAAAAAPFQLIIGNPNGGATQTIAGGLTISNDLTINGNALFGTNSYLFMNRTANTNARIQWYNNATFKTWMDYMAPGGSGGPNGVTPSTGSLVTSWARRFNVENQAGYGWVFESTTSTGTTPVTRFEISSVDGSFHSTGNGTVDGNLVVKGNTTHGDANTDVRYEHGYEIEIHDLVNVTVMNADGTIASVTEKNGGTTVKTTTFSYNADGTLNVVTIVGGGKTVTITNSYSSGDWTGATRTVT
jgi:hypothetical protein